MWPVLNWSRHMKICSESEWSIKIISLEIYQFRYQCDFFSFFSLYSCRRQSMIGDHHHIDFFLRFVFHFTSLSLSSTTILYSLFHSFCTIVHTVSVHPFQFLPTCKNSHFVCFHVLFMFVVILFLVKCVNVIVLLNKIGCTKIYVLFLLISCYLFFLLQ